MLAGAGLAYLAIAMQPDLNWKTILLAALSFDIGAGLVSNATQGTREAWRQNPGRGPMITFLIVHLTAFPAALFWLSQGNLELFAVLTCFLAAKVLLFYAGQSE